MSTWKVVPGTTVNFVYRWGSSPLIYVPVAVVVLTPLRFTATSHAIPDGWSVAVADLPDGPRLIAANWPPQKCDYQAIRVVDANTIEFNTIDASRITSMSVGSTGTIAYETPTDLAGMTGSFTVDSFVSPFTPVFNNTTKTITVTMTAVQTATLSVGAILNFDFLVTDSGSAVTQLDFGTIEVVDGSHC